MIPESEEIGAKVANVELTAVIMQTSFEALKKMQNCKLFFVSWSLGKSSFAYLNLFSAISNRLQ